MKKTKNHKTGLAKILITILVFTILALLIREVIIYKVMDNDPGIEVILPPHKTDSDENEVDSEN